MSNSAPRKRGQPDFGSNGMKSEQTAVEARFAEAQSRLGRFRVACLRSCLLSTASTSATGQAAGRAIGNCVTFRYGRGS